VALGWLFDENRLTQLHCGFTFYHGNKKLKYSVLLPLIIASFVVVGCGQYGALYLPGQKNPQVTNQQSQSSLIKKAVESDEPVSPVTNA